MENKGEKSLERVQKSEDVLQARVFEENNKNAENPCTAKEDGQGDDGSKKLQFGLLFSGGFS